MWGKEGVFYQIVSVFTGAPIYFRSQHRPPPRTFFGSGEIDSRDGGPHWFLASCLGPRLLLVSAPVVAMPDDDQLSDLASVQILSHPHLAQIRSRSHQWPPRATVPEPLQAAGKLPCATTLSSLDAAVVTRRRRRVTSFAFPSGGAPTGASLHLRLPLRRRRPRHRVRRLHLRHRLRRLRPAIPASSTHLRRDVQLGFRRRLRRRQPRLGVPPGPRPTACGPTNRHM
jgi:hypothetical protein